MSYTKTNWQTGDTITAEKLNHAEQGIYDNSTSGGVLIVNGVIDEQTTTTTLDKTWQEIHNADFAVVSIEYTDADTGETGLTKWPVINTAYAEGDGYFVYIMSTSTNVYIANSANGYPSDNIDGEGEVGVS